MEKAPGDGSCGVPKRDATSGGSPHGGTGGGESEAERHGDVAVSGTDGNEKKMNMVSKVGSTDKSIPENRERGSSGK